MLSWSVILLNLILLGGGGVLRAVNGEGSSIPYHLRPYFEGQSHRNGIPEDTETNAGRKGNNNSSHFISQAFIVVRKVIKK